MKKIFEQVFGLLSLLGFLFILGIIGSVEMGTLSVSKGMVYLLVGTVGSVISTFIFVKLSEGEF